MNNPLNNKRIVVTRAREQSHALSEKLIDLGATVIEIPAIRIAELDPVPLKAAIGRLHDYSLVVFTSASAVHVFLPHLNEHPEQAERLGSIPIAVIGSATGRALEEYGFRASIVPEEFFAEGLVAAIHQSGLFLTNRRVLIPRAKKARAVLNRELVSLGAIVDDIPIYETIPENFSQDAALMKQLSPAPDIVTFTSSSTVTYFIAGLPDDLLRELQTNSIAACIGPIAAETARSAGFKVEIVPEQYSIDGLVGGIVTYCK